MTGSCHDENAYEQSAVLHTMWQIRSGLKMLASAQDKNEQCQERGLNTRPPELQSVALPAELSRLVTSDQHALVALNTHVSRIQEGKMRSAPVLFKP